MPSRATAEECRQLDAVVAQLDSIVIGKSNELKLAFATLLAGGHLLVEDIPGVGKTTLARALAASIGLNWNRVQFTSDLLPADVIGISIFDVHKQTFKFHEGPVFTSLLLADELNRAPPKTQSALLEGVYPLPESQLDRFMVSIELGYPDSNSEREILAGTDRRDLLASVESVMSVDNLLYWQAKARQIHTAPAVLDYVQALLAATRELALNGKCNAGLSPRAGLSLLSMCRAWALLHGRDMVLPEDVQSVFTSVASHRIAGSLRKGLPLTRELLTQVEPG